MIENHNNESERDFVIINCFPSQELHDLLNHNGYRFSLMKDAEKCYYVFAKEDVAAFMELTQQKAEVSQPTSLFVDLLGMQEWYYKKRCEVTFEQLNEEQNHD